MAGDKILIITEDKQTLILLKTIFQEEGYQIFSSQHEQELVQRIIDITPCLIILDIIMPDVEGLKLLRILKQHELLSHIPVVVLTLSQDTDLKLAALRLGAIDYLLKPFQKEELLYRIKNIIKFNSHTSVNDVPFLVNQLFSANADVIIPQLDKTSPFGYAYPQMEKVINPNEITSVIDHFELLTQQGYLEKIFHDVIHLCPWCKNYHINFREMCPYCHHVLDDEGKSVNFECRNCQRRFPQPDMSYMCINCGEIFTRSQLLKKNIYKYKRVARQLLVTRPAVSQNNTILARAFNEAQLSAISYDLFKNKIAQEISLIGENKYNLTVMSIEIKKLEMLESKLGTTAVLKLLKSILVVVKKYLRPADVMSCKDDVNILLLLPKIHLNMAKIIAEKVQSYLESINQEIELEIKLASYPEDGYNETEILTMLEMGIETVKVKYSP